MSINEYNTNQSTPQIISNVSNISTPNMDNTQTSSEKDFYLSNLSSELSKLKKNLISLLLLSLIDILCVFLIPYYFKNFFNIFVSFVLLLSSSVLLYFYFKDYSHIEYIEQNAFKKVVYSAYLILFVGTLSLFNNAFIIFVYIISGNEVWRKYLRNKDSFCDKISLVVGFCAYFILNIIFPFIILKRLIKVRDIFKAVGNLEGQEYSVTYTVNNIPTIGIGEEGEGSDTGRNMNNIIDSLEENKNSNSNSINDNNIKDNNVDIK